MALSGFLQNAANKSVSTSKDISKKVNKGITTVDAINQIDICNLISYFLNQAIPSGSNIEKAFQDLKKVATDLLQKIEDAESDLLNTPFKRGSVAPDAIPLTGSMTGSGNTPSSYSSNPSTSNTVSGSLPAYGGGGTFNTPPAPTSVSSSVSNAGTSAGQGLTLDQSLEKLRAVKGIISSINIPPFLLRIIPGGKNISDSIQRLTTQIPDNISNFPNQDLQKIFTTFTEIKTLLNGISQAENPADLISVFKAQNAIAKLQDILNPAQLIPVLNQLVRSVEVVARILNNLANYINRLAQIVNTLNTIVKILAKLAKVIRNLPLPARWATVGVILKLQKLAETLEKRTEVAQSNLDQTSQFLNVFSRSLNSVRDRINTLLEALRILLQKLQSCAKTKDLPITKKLKDTIINLESTLDTINNALPKKPANKRQIQYKGLTLDIIEEQVVDEGIVLTRRYGVALDARGVIVTQTDLTFATNLELIYNELRFLIDKDKLGEQTSQALSEDELISAELDLPTEAEQLADEAATQAEIDNLIKQIQPEENLRQERSKKDKRKFKRFKRVINRLKKQGLTKEQIRNRVLNKNRFDNFSEQDFEEAYNASNNLVDKLEAAKKEKAANAQKSQQTQSPTGT